MENEKEKIYRPMITLCGFLIALNIYWFAYELFYNFGAVSSVSDQLLGQLMRSGAFDSQYTLKGIVLLFLGMGSLVRMGRFSYTPWKDILIYTAFSLVMYLLPYFNPVVYIITTIAGFIMTAIAFGRIGNKLRGMKNPISNAHETFDQGIDHPIDTPYSVNFRIKYMYQNRWHKAWLPVVNPFGGTFVFGQPGCGKTYAILNEFIWQLIHKGFTAYVYDFKIFDLSVYSYNCFLRSKDVYKKLYGVEPEFHFLFMADPRYSTRCNPLDPKYIKDITAAIQKAKIIRKNRMDPVKDVGFFADNAQSMWVAGIWALRKTLDGRYCTLPHFIELMLSPQEKLMKLFMEIPDCRAIVQDILKADQEGAKEQSQGIYASATTPLKELRTERAYWLFSANNVDLQINRPDRPTVLCVGNDPKAKDVFATGIALITSELYLQVNQPDRAPCLLAQDEYPTKKDEGYDTILATGRSNKLAGLAAAQDMEQLNRDLKPEYAKALISTNNNQFFGKVLSQLGNDISEMFGQHRVMHQSETTGGQSDTMQTSFQLEKRLPKDKIAGLSQGNFAAIVMDGSGEEALDNKFFCAQFLIDPNSRPNKNDGQWQPMPMFAKDQFNQDATQKRVEANYDKYCIEQLFRELKQEDLERSKNDEDYSSKNDALLGKLAKEKYEKMSASKKKELRKETMDYELEHAMEEVLQKHMEKIAAERDLVFDHWGVKDAQTAAGPKPTAGRPLNGDEKPTVDDMNEFFSPKATGEEA